MFALVFVVVCLLVVVVRLHYPSMLRSYTCQDGRRCEILVAGDMVWNELDEEITKWFQFAASYKNGCCKDHHISTGVNMRDRLKSLRRSRRAELSR